MKLWNLLPAKPCGMQVIAVLSEWATVILDDAMCNLKSVRLD